MSPRPVILHVVFLGIVVVVAASMRSHDSLAKDQQPVRTVNARDLLKDVQIIGTLGKPLGELVTVRGTWQRGDFKEADAFFVVSVVDDKAIETEARFADMAVRAVWSPGEPTIEDGKAWDWRVRSGGKKSPAKTGEVGEEWEMIGAEVGSIVVPKSSEFWNKAGVTMGQQRPGFHAGFSFIALRRIDRETQQAPPQRTRQRTRSD